MYNKFLFQLVTLSNFFLNIYILFILLAIGRLEIVGEGFVVISLINVFTYGFSANIRNIYLGNKDSANIKNFLFLRIKIGIYALIFSSIVVFFLISKENILFHVTLIGLTIVNWIIEIFIARNEKSNKLNINHALNILFFIIFYPIFAFLNFDESLIFLILFFILINLIIFVTPIKNIIRLREIYSKNKKVNFSLGISSTLLKTISNLIWRYSIFLILGKSQSALLFLGFSFGSFFGTLFDISYGALFLKNFKKYKYFFLNMIYIIYILLISIFLFYFIKFSSLSSLELNMLYVTSGFSIVGAYIMIFALDIRQGLFEIKNMQNTCYKIDIYLFVLIALLIPILNLINLELIYSAYFIVSILFYVLYKIVSVKALQKKL
jgi:hypothetical protein